MERARPQCRIPVYSVLVEHDEGLFLLDTGIDLDHMNRVLPFELPEQTEEQTIPAQLEKCGFGLGDVTVLVNSHLHIDHVGGNQLFEDTAVPNLIHERSWRRRVTTRRSSSSATRTSRGTTRARTS